MFDMSRFLARCEVDEDSREVESSILSAAKTFLLFLFTFFPTVKNPRKQTRERSDEVNRRFLARLRELDPLQSNRQWLHLCHGRPRFLRLILPLLAVFWSLPRPCRKQEHHVQMARFSLSFRVEICLQERAHKTPSCSSPHRGSSGWTGATDKVWPDCP